MQSFWTSNRQDAAEHGNPPCCEEVPLPRELDAAIADLIDRGQGAQDQAVTLATQCGHGWRIGAVWSGYDDTSSG
jgi:hypothetical protein